MLIWRATYSLAPLGFLGEAVERLQAFVDRDAKSGLHGGCLSLAHERLGDYGRAAAELLSANLESSYPLVGLRSEVVRLIRTGCIVEAHAAARAMEATCYYRAAERNRPIASFRNLASAGLLAAPAVCPHSDGIGVRFTPGINAAS